MSANNNDDRAAARGERADARGERADARAERAEVRSEAMEHQAKELIGHVDVLTGEVRNLANVLHRRNLYLMGMAVLVLVIGMAFISILIRVSGVVQEVQAVGHRVDRQAIVNNITQLDHRLRHERCVVQPIRRFFDATITNRPLPPFPETCRRENTVQLEAERKKATEKLRRANGGS